MVAPPSGLLAALRDPQVGVARHVFFKLVHSQGTVRVWDGIGDITLDSETYSGIGDLASLAGISQSFELQTHQVEARLQGVSLDALRITDQNIRGDAATIKVAWFDNEGNAYSSRTVFAGAGDNLSIDLDEDTCTVICRLRAPMANWARPPASYYTTADQQRLHVFDPPDTGMQFVPEMAAAQASGWSINEETSGGKPVAGRIAALSATVEVVVPCLFDDLSLRPIGHHTQGIAIRFAAPTSDILHRQSTIAFYKEPSSGAEVTATQYGTLKVGGNDLYIDAAGDVRTVAGEQVTREAQSAANRMRVCGAIASNGSPIAGAIRRETLPGTAYHGEPYFNTDRTFAHIGAEVHTAPADWSNAIFCNKYGALGGTVNTANNRVGLPARLIADETRSWMYYDEASTGNQVTLTASGDMQVSGANCVITDTGVVLTAAGNRLVLSNGDSDAFLRVWT